MIHRVRAWVVRLFASVRGTPGDHGLADELASHLQLHIDDNLRAGMSPDEARRQALLKLGGLDQTKEAHRDRRGLPWVDGLAQDLHFALRAFRRSPGFTVTVVATLAVGIGATTAIFSVLNAVLIRSFPYKSPDRLVYVWTPSRSLPKIPLEAFEPSAGDFFDIQREAHSFSASTLFDQESFNLAAGGTVQRVSGTFVLPSFFPTFGVQPRFGRSIESADTEPGSEHVAIISYGLWQSAFGRSSRILGQTLTLNGQPYRVVGVMPASFGYPSGNELPYSNAGETQVWLPWAMTPQQKTSRDLFSGNVVARLRPGVTVAGAQAELDTIMPRLNALRAPGGIFTGIHAVVKSFPETVVGGVRLFVWLLFGAVCLVLLIACANAANLLLARAAGRRHEMGVRSALGASCGRLLRQGLTEAVLLSCCGCLLGILMADAAIRLLLRLDPGNIARLSHTSIDVRVLLFAVTLSFVTGIAFGILPALFVSRGNASGFLIRSRSQGAGGASPRWRRSLITSEVALAVVLLAGSGLLIHSYLNLQEVSMGFSESTLTMSIALDQRDSKVEQRRAFFHGVVGKLAVLPGVSAVGAVNDLPLSHSETLATFSVEGYTNQKGQTVSSRLATERYFEAMGTPLLAGRWFSVDDGAKGTERVVIVNQAFADAYLRGRPAVGAHVCLCYVSSAPPPWSTIIGVVGNTRASNLEDAPPPQVYQPFWQDDATPGRAYIAVRTSERPLQAIPAIRRAVRSIDPTLAVSDVQTMEQRVSEASALRRFQMSLFVVFGVVALFLAAIGLYGVMAYSVRQRTAEVGIRLALGAEPSTILTLIVRQGMTLTTIGVVIGLAGAFALTRLLSSLLYRTAPGDPATFVFVVAVLLVTSLVACYVPARRAMRVEPVEALREN
jgi:predicted permease